MRARLRVCAVYAMCYVERALMVAIRRWALKDRS